MVAETIRVFIVSSILGCMLVNGLPSGAPQAACSTITPNHPGASPSTSAVPFTVDLSSIPSRGYIPGQTHNIILRSSSSHPNFRGFLIQGRVRADDSSAGSFGSGTNYKSQCGNSAATHTNRNDKTSVTLVWTAPPAGTGCICFRYAFVDTYTVFWANETTQCISENLQTTIQASSSGTINGNDFTITLSANVAGDFECSLDGAAFQSCSSGDVFSDLSVGSHTMNVRFTPAGSCESFALRPPLNINIIQPTTTPTTGPIQVSINGSVSVRGNAATITLNNNFNGVFRCSLDGGNFQNCQSGDVFTGLSAGSHTINVQFTPAGLSQILRLTLRFTVVMMATVVPSPTPTPTEIQASGSATVTGNSVNLTLTSNFPGRFQCSLNGRRFRRCSTGTTFTGLSVGNHTIVIRFTPTGSSQTSTLQPPLTFTISPPSTPPPEVNLDVTVTATGNKLTVTYDISETATCTCQLDSGTPVTCNSGHMFNNVAAGDHTVTVSCTTNSVMISRSVDISVSEPVTFTVTGRQQISGNDVQVFFNSTLPATFQCRLDSNPPVACVSGHTFSDVDAGRHRIQLTARLISNRQTRRTLRLPRFTIRPPTTTSPPPPPPPHVTASAQVFTNCSARLRFSADVPVTYRCRVNGGPWKPCSDGYLVSDLPPGTNEIEIEASSVQAPDAKTVVTATLVIKGQACSVLEINCPVCNPSTIVGNNFTFTFNANKPNVEYTCSLNNKRPSPCNEGSVTYTNLRNRRNQLVTVTATSCNGETVTKNITFSPKYNRRFCQVYTCGDGLVTSDSSASVAFLGDDPDATFRCKLDNQRRRSCTSPLVLNDLSSGSHRLDISPRCIRNARGRRLRLRFSIP